LPFTLIVLLNKPPSIVQLEPQVEISATKFRYWILVWAGFILCRCSKPTRLRFSLTLCTDLLTVTSILHTRGVSHQNAMCISCLIRNTCSDHRNLFYFAAEWGRNFADVVGIEPFQTRCKGVRRPVIPSSRERRFEMNYSVIRLVFPINTDPLTFRHRTSCI